MGQFEFASPGVPIYKANIIPFMENDTPVHCKELDAVTVRKWQRMLEKMNSFLVEVRRIAETFVAGLPSDERNYRLLELVGDAITAYLKMPLHRDPLLGLAPSPFTFYLATRIAYPRIKRVPDKPIDFLEGITWEIVDGLHEKIRNIVPEELDHLWFSVPADTRPLYNTSGLIPHLLATSAITWALAVRRGLDREEAAMLRLAAIFHDIAKPFNYRQHVELAPEVVKKVLSGVMDKETVEEIAQYTKTHHGQAQTTQSQILSEADRYASAADRLGRLAEKLVYPKLKEKGLTKEEIDKGYAYGKEAWEFWRWLEQEKPGIIRQLSEEVARQLQEPSNDLRKLLRGEGEGSVGAGGLRLLLIDIGSIQEFITRARDLRSQTAASLVVETATVAHLPLLIQSIIDRESNHWVPLEAFLIVSGGTLTLLLPSQIAAKLTELWEPRIASRYEKDRLRIYLAGTDYTGNQYRDSGELARNSYLEKISYEPSGDLRKEVGIIGAAPNLCTNCYSEERAKGSELCESCRKLKEELGIKLHFKKRWENGLQLKGSRITPKEAFGLDYDIEVKKKDIMYVIAGHERPELQPGERKRNVAVMKFDGNLMGMFFAEAVSLSDTLERSARVDLALKRSLERALIDLYEGIQQAADDSYAKKAVSSCFLGMMYAGGDDALLLCPSWCAIPMALAVARYFQEGMGGVRALSVGVAASPPEHDVWALIDAANTLLTKAKNRSREGERAGKEGWLAFDFIEGGVLSGTSVSERLRAAEDEGFSTQPLSLAQDTPNPSLTGILNTLRIPVDSKSLFLFAFMSSRDAKTIPPCFEKKMQEKQEYLKGLRSELLQSISVSRSILGGSERSKIFTLHIHRMREAISEATKEGMKRKGYYEVLSRLLSNAVLDGRGLRFPILEVSLLVKFLGGGVL